MIADQAEAKRVAAESAALAAQTQKDYAASNAWTQQQTAAINAQTAAMGNTTSGTTAGATAATSSGPPALWKSYEQYWRDKGEWDTAKSYSGYHSSTDPRKEDNSRWGKVGNPYRFTYEYDNDYLSTLPPGQQATARAGVGPDWVTGGLTNKVLTGSGVIPIEGADYYWQNPTHIAEAAAAQKAQQAAWAAASGGSGGGGAPKRPTGKVSWQG
jgi:hypothetical protein